MQHILELAQKAKAEFVKCYNTKPTWIVAAPGRVNLIGEHTDYNDGFVFPMAIERYTVIAAGPVEDGVNEATVYSLSKTEPATFKVDGTVPPPEPVDWWSYILGTINCVAGCASCEGIATSPFRAVVVTNVPLGGGLSSSAALEVATATLIEEMNGKKIGDEQKALLCQKAEHEYAHMPCGIMDQFISAMGREGYAMLLDCRSREPKMVPIDDPSVSVLIINSNVKHELTGSEYPDRRRQCEKSAHLLGVSKLRDATMEMLEKAKPIFDKEADGDICFRRAKHVITENDRTVAAAYALHKKQWAECGRLMYESHHSMRHDFEITCKELDLMVDIAKTVDGVFGCRMTGGGFGGCTVSLVETEKVESIIAEVGSRYKEKTGIEPTAFATRPAQGAGVIR